LSREQLSNSVGLILRLVRELLYVRPKYGIKAMPASDTLSLNLVITLIRR